MGISRTELWKLLQGPSTPASSALVPPLLMEAYAHALASEWREEDRSPHGQKWHTSFHASAFPGDDEHACGRRSVYGLLDPAVRKPRTPYLQAWFDIGNALEDSWVARLRGYGSLLAPALVDGRFVQRGFEDSDSWLTGSCDAIVLPRRWKKSYPVEIKTTDHDKVLSMRSRSPQFPRDHGKYLRQLKTYIGLAFEEPYTPTVNICDESGAIIYPEDDYICPIHGNRCAFETVTLLPPDEGELIYSSREEPLTTASFRVFHDPELLAVGRSRLHDWRDSFLRGEIPEHPYEGRAKKWTAPACQYCEYKGAFCKADYTEGIRTLEASNLIPLTRQIRPDYEYDQKRSAVLSRWGAHDQSGQKEEEIGVGN